MRYVISAGIIMTFVSAGQAEPPRSGVMVSFRHPLILCNQQSQVKDMIDAQRISTEAFNKKAVELNEAKECQIAYLTNVVVRDSEDIGTVMFGEHEEHLWIMTIETGAKKLAALYEEQTEGTEQESSI